MEQISDRISILGAEIRIRSPKQRFKLIALCALLGFWIFLGIRAVQTLMSGEAEVKGFDSEFLLAWSLIGLISIVGFLWDAFGYEVIKVKNQKLEIKLAIFGYGPTRRYMIHKIFNLRASGYVAPPSSWFSDSEESNLIGGSVAFDYKNKVRRFGLQLDEAGANQVVKILKERHQIAIT